MHIHTHNQQKVEETATSSFALTMCVALCKRKLVRLWIKVIAPSVAKNVIALNKYTYNMKTVTGIWREKSRSVSAETPGESFGCGSLPEFSGTWSKSVEMRMFIFKTANNYSIVIYIEWVGIGWVVVPEWRAYLIMNCTHPKGVVGRKDRHPHPHQRLSRPPTNQIHYKREYQHISQSPHNERWKSSITANRNTIASHNLPLLYTFSIHVSYNNRKRFICIE